MKTKLEQIRELLEGHIDVHCDHGYKSVEYIMTYKDHYYTLGCNTNSPSKIINERLPKVAIDIIIENLEKTDEAFQNLFLILLKKDNK